MSSSQSEGEESEGGVEEITEFDIGLPLTLQIHRRVTPLREEYKKRRQWPDRERLVVCMKCWLAVTVHLTGVSPHL